ncbi:Asp23/Gls24 family envelope stress response protein [Streptomyces sp. NPDC050264]|uniref:Asp23/Gls24 family envelope stress response protein n=1 Tax=Streptomyces sp. NPDC050264 TaxID=3155038 RepID=UPI00343A4150
MSDIGLGSGSTTTPSADQSGTRGTRGTTTIADSVVATIAGIAIRDTEGVRSVGKSAKKALGAVTGRMPGSSTAGRPVKVEVDDKQVTIGVDVEVEYGVLIHELADQIRTHVIDAVETMTGLDVTEININVFDVHIPDEDDDDDDDDDNNDESGGGAGARSDRLR